MSEEQKFSITYIREITGRSQQSIVQWAKKHGVETISVQKYDVKDENLKYANRYMFTEEQVQAFLEYVRKPTRTRKDLKKTDKLPTLYQRARRYKLNGDEKRYNDTLNLIELAKEEKRKNK